MKILYISQYFPPEMGAPAARAAEMSRHWANAGHEVTVLTGFPNHPTGVVPNEYRKKFRRLVAREQVDEVNLIRTWLLPFPNRKAYERILNYISFAVSAALTGLALSRPDVVIATSPQLLVGLSGWWLAEWKRVPFVFEVRDLWPESLAAVGMGRADSSLHRMLGK
ncbi:MAG: glycosyltransferase, partial [Candidatus Sulfotelmatobacter sp.]